MEPSGFLGKCKECGADHRVGHTPECSWSVPLEDREQFIRDNAVQMVRKLEKVIRNQRTALSQQANVIRGLQVENKKLRAGQGVPADSH